ncbi:MAG: hypothetical protein INQ03_21100 [Candidatus Heimdallarchaeota archaeon]|nr:hypothetical protein [Candidatus Heimdallarchaeota archaeon]
MKKIILAALLIGSFFTILAPATVMAQDYTCTEADATATLTIKAIAGTQFDTSKITVTPDTCYKVELVNDDPSAEHNFKVTGDRALGGTDDDSGFHFLVGGEFGIASGETDVVYIKMPATEGKYYFYCTISGHEPTMNGAFFVGEDPEDAPGFGFYMALLGLVAAIPILRKRN